MSAVQINPTTNRSMSAPEPAAPKDPLAGMTLLTAEGQKQAAILRAEGEAKAIATVFQAIHDGDADQKLLSYQYLQMLPQLAQGDANKVFVIPSEFSEAFGGIARGLGASRDPEPPAQ